MMALSTFPNWNTLQFSNSEQSTSHETMPQQVAPPNLQHSFPYSHHESLFLSNAHFDSYLDPIDGFFNPPKIHHSFNEPLIPLTHHDIFPTDEDDYNLILYPKRPKCWYDQQQHEQYSSLQEFSTPELSSNFLDGSVMPYYENGCSVQTEEPQQEQLYFDVPQTCVNFECEKKGNDRTISPQSVTARERRRKITQKTQELGKLIPGGPKMNTADMLNAAAKYVRFLQAQFEMLRLITTHQEDETTSPSENLHALVVSPFVQEKLYNEEMCLVPKEIVTTLTNHEDVQSKPTILEDLKQLIGSDIEKKAKQE